MSLTRIVKEHQEREAAWMHSRKLVRWCVECCVTGKTSHNSGREWCAPTTDRQHDHLSVHFARCSRPITIVCRAFTFREHVSVQSNCGRRPLLAWTRSRTVLPTERFLKQTQTRNLKLTRLRIPSLIKPAL